MFASCISIADVKSQDSIPAFPNAATALRERLTEADKMPQLLEDWPDCGHFLTQLLCTTLCHHMLLVQQLLFCSRHLPLPVFRASNPRKQSGLLAERYRC